MQKKLEHSPWNDKLKKKLEHAEETDFACRCNDFFRRYFIMDDTARLSFNLLLWVNDNGKADARLIYDELAKEALLRLHTRTTDWQNDSAMLQQEVKKKVQKAFPRRSLDKIEAFVREKMLKISLHQKRPRP